MNEKDFKSAFAVVFIATWAANNYDDACMNGRQETLSKPPVEDAIFLADKAWSEWQEHADIEE